MRIVVLLLICLAACARPAPIGADASPPPPPPPPIFDAGTSLFPKGPGADCIEACKALRAAGCPEGRVGTCYRISAQVEIAGKISGPAGKFTCAAAKTITTPAQARALGVPCLNPTTPSSL